MNKDKNKNKLFREKMQNFSKEPPADIWEGIQEELKQEKKARILPLFWRYAAGILILIGIGTAVFISNFTGEISDQNFLSEEKNQSTEKHTAKPLNNDLDTEKEQTKEIIEERFKEEIPQNVNSNKSEIHIASKTENPNMKIPDIHRVKGQLSDQQEIIGNDSSIAIIKKTPKVITKLPLQIKIAIEEQDILVSSVLERQYAWDDLIAEDQDAYNEITTGSDKSRFSMTAQLSPLYTYRDIGNASPVTNQLFNDSESGKVSYAGGLNLGIETGKRLSFHTGVIYSRMGIEVNDIYAVTAIKNIIRENLSPVYDSRASSAYLVNNSIGSIEQGDWSRPKYDYSSQNAESTTAQPNSGLTYLDAGGFYNPANNYIQEKGKIDQYFHYLEIPFMLKYKIIERKIDINVLGGVSTHFLIGNKVYYTLGNQAEYLGHTSDIQSFNYSGNIGFGLDYYISEDFSFLFEPQFKYYLNSVNINSLIENRPYSFGLYTGFLYQF